MNPIYLEKKNRGFSLLELSVVLVIIGIIVGGTVAIGITQVEAAREAQTRQKMTIIEDALLNYRRLNNRLPCPNSYSLPETDNTYGFETGNAGACAGNLLPADSSARGALPVKALNLPADFMVDGWGEKLSYIVTINATANSAFKTGSLNTMQTNGSIVIKDTSTNNITTGAVYAVVSHGKNGYGGYLKTGAQKTAGSTNTIELVNCRCSGSGSDTSIYNGPFINNTDPNQIYDDITLFKTRMQLPGYEE